MDTLFSFLAEHFDLPILDWIAENITCPLLDTVIPFITKLGDRGYFWIAFALLLALFPKTRKAGITMALALLMGLLVCNVVMKPLFARIRPYEYQRLFHDRVIPLLIHPESSFSFPSGHTIASFEAATAILLRHRKLGTAAMVLAILIAFSRMYLYVHYPTDVIVSVFLGISLAVLASWIVNKVSAAIQAKKA